MATMQRTSTQVITNHRLSRLQAGQSVASLSLENRVLSNRAIKQRLKLIEATISALYAFGPSKTTVDRVVSIAEMSPGIVSFYFSSKDEMLIAALRHLADEFIVLAIEPVEAMCDQPIVAMNLLIELFLDANCSDSRKVAVWYAFWGEANAKFEYLDTCRSVDIRCHELIKGLMIRLAAFEPESQRLHIDSLAMGLSGLIELVWQEIAFKPKDANKIRREGKLRSMAFLASIFPHSFSFNSKLEKPVIGQSKKQIQSHAKKSAQRVEISTLAFARSTL